MFLDECIEDELDHSASCVVQLPCACTLTTTIVAIIIVVIVITIVVIIGIIVVGFVINRETFKEERVGSI